MDELYGIVYKATNKINSKAYIGQTIKSLEKRKSCHVSRALHNKSNNYFHNAIRKYGIEGFDWEIVDEHINVESLNRMEIYYIGYYDTFSNGYNLTLGGGGAPSVETRKKLSISLMGKRTGFKHSVEARKRMSIARIGKKHPWYGKHHSDKTKRKISDAQMGEKNHNYGKRTSLEAKQKMSKATSGKNNPSAIAIIIGDKYFDTRKEAAEFVGISSSTIRQRILHKTKWLNYSYAK